MGKGGSLRRARCNVLMKVAKGIMSLIKLVHLKRSVMDVYLRNMNRYALERPVVLVRANLGHALHPGIHMRDSNAPGVIDQRRSDSETVKVTDSNRLGAKVNDALITHVDVVGILRST